MPPRNVAKMTPYTNSKYAVPQQLECSPKGLESVCLAWFWLGFVVLFLFSHLLLDLGDLLALQRRRGDLHPEDNVSDLRLRERGNVDVVLLAVVREDKVLQGHLDLHEHTAEKSKQQTYAPFLMLRSQTAHHISGKQQIHFWREL